MNVRFLEAFVWVARLGSFKAASDKLGTTQAGIASRIATLEEQFSVRLFDRDSRGVQLTYHGSELLPRAERMIELQAQMMQSIGQPKAFTGMLRIGAMETVVQTWLPDLLTRFTRQYPEATLELSSDITPRLRDDLLRGALDCAITTEEMTPGFIDNRRLGHLTMRWVASPTMAATIASSRRLAFANLAFADLARHPILSFHRESCVYRNIAQNAVGCGPLRVSYFSSLGAMVDLVRAGFGSAILPVGVILKDLAEGRLVVLDVDPAPLDLPLVASTRIEPSLPLAEALVELAQQASEDFIRRGGEGVARG